MQSAGQRARFHPLKNKAWLAVCRRHGIRPNDRRAFESWYRAELRDNFGWYTSNQCSTPDQFAALMLHFAEIAGDEYWINRLSTERERRIKYHLRRYMADLEFLEGRPVTWPYIRAILDHMRLPGDINICPDDLLRKVLQALDIHVRRIAKRRDIPLSSLPRNKRRASRRVA